MKTIEDQAKNKLNSLDFQKPVEQKVTTKDVIPEDQLNEEAENEIENI